MTVYNIWEDNSIKLKFMMEVDKSAVRYKADHKAFEELAPQSACYKRKVKIDNFLRAMLSKSEIWKKHILTLVGGEEFISSNTVRKIMKKTKIRIMFMD